MIAKPKARPALFQGLTQWQTRLTNIFSLALSCGALLALGGCSAESSVSDQHSDSDVVIVVANLGDSEGKALQETIVEALKTATADYRDIHLEVLPEEIMQRSSSEIGQLLREEYNADLLLWGSSTQIDGADGVNLNLHRLKPPESLPEQVGNLKTEARNDVLFSPKVAFEFEPETFTTKLKLPAEQDYLSSLVLGRARYVAADWSEAVQHFEQSLESIDLSQERFNGLEVLNFQAAAQVLDADLEAAIATYEQAIQWDGSVDAADVAFLNHQGVALSLLSRYEEAIDLYDQAIAINPDEALTHLNRGLSQIGLGEVEAAIASYDQALELNPDDLEAQLSKSSALLILKRDYDALAAAELALKSHPKDENALLQKSEVLRRLGRGQKAMALVEDAIEANPSNAMALYAKGQLLANAGRYEEAIATYDEALALRPGFARALNNKGDALLQLGQPQEALANFEAALESNPGYALALFNKAVVLGELGQDEGAIATYEALLVIQPENVDALSNKGFVLARERWYEEAIAIYDRALAIEPGAAKVLFNKGDALLSLGRYEAALDYFTESAEVEPHEIPLFKRAYVLVLLNRNEEALVASDAALALNPVLPEAVYNKALALANLKRSDEALGQLKQALVLNPSLKSVAATDPGFHALRNQASFHNLLRP